MTARTLAIACMFSASCLAGAQVALPVPGPAPDAPPPGPIILEVTALRGSPSGRGGANVDAGLRKILQQVSRDAFERVAEKTVSAPYGQETLIPINERYGLYVLPVRKNEKGEVELEYRLAMAQEEGPVDALFGTATAAPRKPLLFHGLKLGDDELVVVMRLLQEEDEDQDSSSDPREDQDQQDEQDQQQDSGPQDGDQNQSQPRESEENLPEDLQNIEALLESLEEIDEREQRELRNQRPAFRIPRNWW